MIPDPLHDLAPPWATSTDFHIDLSREGWTLFYDRYRWAWDAEPMRWVVSHMRALGVTRVQVEPFIDGDYRDEFAHFYVDTFTPPSAWCERLHLYRRDAYLGYCTLRPIPLRPVGRTLVTPGRRLAEHISCLTEANPRPYGDPLSVTAFPFLSQDLQYGRCAHAVIWMIAYYHHLRNHCPRVYMSDIVGAATPQESGRLFPSGGLTIPQIGVVFRELGLPMQKYNVQSLSPAEVQAIIGRYLNSRMPLALGAGHHMTAVIGYQRDYDGSFAVITADDQQGAYVHQKVTPELKNSWHTLMVPLPTRIYLSGENAQRFAHLAFARLLRAPAVADLAAAVAARKLRIRTYVVHSRAYRAGLDDRDLPPDVATSHLHNLMPRWIWVAELQDAEVAQTSRDCVIGELAIDTTSDAGSPGLLFGNLGDAVATYSQGDNIARTGAKGIELYKTGTALNA